MRDVRQTADRWWHILRYHHKSQLLMRLVTVGRRKWLGLTGGGRYTRPPSPMPARRDNPGFRDIVADRLAVHQAAEAHEAAARIMEGRFSFLEVEYALADPIDWRLTEWPDAPHLWRFHLHYHDFLVDLIFQGVDCGKRTYFDRAWSIVEQWIDANRLDDKRTLLDAWHPYCISRRLPVWMLLWAADDRRPEPPDQFVASMVSQTRFLADHLELDVCGNHLLENLHALALSGAFFDGPLAKRWLRQATTRLRKELASQVLPSGEHFERSPMYHAQMLQAVLDVRDVTRVVDGELAATCEQVGLSMAEFLERVLHPDSQIPLLGDSYLDDHIVPERLIARATPHSEKATMMPQAAATVVGEYWTFRHADDYLLFDAGPVGPDHLPAHAHADLLGLEASVAGQRLFVDCGVFNYQDDPMRSYCRGSAAHNVLMVDGRDQCDMWSRFRMGYRGRPQGFAHGQTQGFFWSRASHDAYSRLGVPRVGRWIACRAGGPWFLVDWIEGAGSHELTSRIHLHPDVRVKQLDDTTFQLQCAAVQLWLRSLTPGAVDLKASTYCPKMGIRQDNHEIRWRASVECPCACAWQLSWSESEAIASFEPPDSLVLCWSQSEEAKRFHPRD